MLSIVSLRRGRARSRPSGFLGITRFALNLLLLGVGIVATWPTIALAQAPVDSSGYVVGVRVGRVDCATCPPRLCPGEPLPVTIVGVLPNGCVQLRGAQLLPTAGPLPIIAIDFFVDSCATACTLEARSFDQQIDLGPNLPGTHQFILLQRIRSCADSTQPAFVNRRIITYDVPDVCPEPVPVDSLIRGFTRLGVVPAEPCVGEAAQLRIVENGCPPCVHITDFRFVPSRDAWVARVEWTPLCAEFNCDIDTLRVPIATNAAGDFALRVITDVVIRGNSDPVIRSFERTVRYTVRPSCEPPVACLESSLPPLMPLLPECSLLLAPGTRGDVVLPVRSGLQAAGAQGMIYVGGPFRIIDVRYAGAAPGALVRWERDGANARFVLFGGSPSVIPVGDSRLLRVTMEAESTSTLGTAGSLHGAITLASDANGVEVKLCPVSASPAPMVVLCVGQPSLGCDVNEDGRTDIRDLVRMIGCLVPELADSSGDRRCPDCDGNGVFQLDDLFCCATQILRGSGLPGDSARVQQGLSIGMDPVEDMGGLYRVRVHMRGTASLSAALLRVRYPADRWRVVPPPASLDPIVPEGWLPLDDVSEPGIARLGALRLVPQASDELHYTLFLERVAGTAGGGEIRVDGADLTLPDGAVVRPAAALPSEPLAPSLLPVTIALSPARPNPFGSATSFVVSFPRAAQAELAIHDLAGRRVATLFQGRIEAGSRTFQWDGTGARDGVYFARLTVEGRVYTSRVALLKNGR